MQNISATVLCLEEYENSERDDLKSVYLDHLKICQRFWDKDKAEVTDLKKKLGDSYTRYYKESEARRGGQWKSIED